MIFPDEGELDAIEDKIVKAFYSGLGTSLHSSLQSGGAERGVSSFGSKPLYHGEMGLIRQINELEPDYIVYMNARYRPDGVTRNEAIAKLTKIMHRRLECGSQSRIGIEIGILCRCAANNPLANPRLIFNTDQWRRTLSPYWTKLRGIDRHLRASALISLINKTKGA